MRKILTLLPILGFVVVPPIVPPPPVPPASAPPAVRAKAVPEARLAPEDEARCPKRSTAPAATTRPHRSHA